MMKKYNKLFKQSRRGIQLRSIGTTRTPHTRITAEYTETHVIIEGDDAKKKKKKREMQIMRVSRMTSLEEHKVASERARLRDGYRSVQKYFKK